MEFFRKGTETSESEEARATLVLRNELQLFATTTLRDELQQFAVTVLQEELAKALDGLQHGHAKKLVDFQFQHNLGEQEEEEELVYPLEPKSHDLIYPSESSSFTPPAGKQVHFARPAAVSTISAIKLEELKPSSIESQYQRRTSTRTLEKNAKTDVQKLFDGMSQWSVTETLWPFRDRKSFGRFFISSSIFLNGVYIGVMTDQQARLVTDDLPTAFTIIEVIFCFIFTVELVINLYTCGLHFFSGPGRLWNMFDTLLVVTQLSDLFASMSKQASTNRGLRQSLRIFRLLRVLRLLRLLRFVESIALIVNSILYSAKSLCWTVMFLVLMTYMVGIMFCQIVFVHRVSLEEDSNELKQYWGSLGLAVLSLYEAILGGLDWHSIIQPLIEEISPIIGLLFCLYIAFALLGVMNIITGTFVQSSFRDANKGQTAEFAQAAREAFSAPDRNTISHDFFLHVVTNSRISSWMAQMQIDPDQALVLFSILEKESPDGDVDIDRLVDGLVRMGEGSKYMDIMKLMHEHYRLIEWTEYMDKTTLEFQEHAGYVKECFKFIDRKLEQIGREIVSNVLKRVTRHLPAEVGCALQHPVSSKLLTV